MCRWLTDGREGKDLLEDSYLKDCEGGNSGKVNNICRENCDKKKLIGMGMVSSSGIRSDKCRRRRESTSKRLDGKVTNVTNQLGKCRKGEGSHRISEASRVLWLHKRISP
jgi:hypothetical protein